MNLNTRSIIALAAAFAAGALVFVPFRSYAGAPAADESGSIAFQPGVNNNDFFVVKNGNRIGLYKIESAGTRLRMVLQDKQILP